MAEEKTIYDLKLHEDMELRGLTVLVVRVSGGWIYSTSTTATFVPYNNEFDDRSIPIPKSYICSLCGKIKRINL